MPEAEERSADARLFQRLVPAGRRLLEGFPSLTPVQRDAIPRILDGRSVLVVARTASGKTEAVLAPLLTRARKGKWTGRPSVLYVAPTRALVSDLHRRIASRLAGLVDVGRRTGEYREPDRDLLFTTPESLDSMLARGGAGDGHSLSGVRAIVLDEVHQLAESARGAQLQVLLSRLDEVTGTPVHRVGLSATVSAPEALARRFLGEDAVVSLTGGHRGLNVRLRNGYGEMPQRGQGIDPLADEILRIDRGPVGARGMASMLLAERRETGRLKALVFVASRARCDELSTALGAALKGRCPARVAAHHGSLDRGHRERTEELLLKAEESVAVATMTLELGIDIGDIGLVVLDGAPGSVSSLLQRVGRSNRRVGTVRVVPLARDDVEAAVLASMIRSAEEGVLDEVPAVAHYSVAIQQLASTLYQGPNARRRRRDLARLLDGILDGEATWALGELEAGGWIEARAEGTVGPANPLRELMESPMRLHGNIGSPGGQTVPLVDGVTGDPIAWVARGGTVRKIVLAGSAFRTVDVGDRIELYSDGTAGTGKPPRYASRGAPAGRPALLHLARGLGLPANALVPLDGTYVHFGGALLGRLLSLAGLESGPLRSAGDPRRLKPGDLARIASKLWENLEPLCGFGPLQSQLPDSLRRKAVIVTVNAHGPEEWLSEMVEQQDLSPRQADVLRQA